MTTLAMKLKDVPTATLAERLQELSHAIAKGDYDALTLRVPAEVDHDADMVIYGAALRLVDIESRALAAESALEKANKELEAMRGQQKPDYWISTDSMALNGEVLVASKNKHQYGDLTVKVPLYLHPAPVSAEWRELMRFYSVDTVDDLIAAQAKHIDRLQAKLPPLRDEMPQEPERCVMTDKPDFAAEVRRLRAEREWRPIETAPKEGKEIILCRGDRVTGGQWMDEINETESLYHDESGEYLGRIETGVFIPASWWSCDGGFTQEEPPTHWMPMPAAIDAAMAGEKS